jgi:DNA-binding beta-propeller fold protein YncE
VQLQSGTDFILYDPFSKRVFPWNEKITAIDAQTGDVAGTLDLGGGPEAGVSGGKGTLYINLADKKAVAVVDPKALSVTKTYPIENCTSPHSLSFDAASQRLFVGCRDGLAVLDAANGKLVGRSLICSGVDAGGFDADNKLIFESCGEGVISVIRQNTPDSYELMETVPTQLFAKTMAFDPKTKNIYLPTAEFETVPSSDPQKPPQRKMKPGSFTVVVVAR